MNKILFISLFNFLDNNSGVTKASVNYVKYSTLIDIILIPIDEGIKKSFIANKNKIIFYKKNFLLGKLIIPDLIFKIIKINPKEIIIEGNVSVIYILCNVLLIKLFCKVKNIYLHMHNIDYDIRYNRNIIIKIITYISEKILYKCVKNVSMVTENDCNRVFKLYKIKPILIPNKIDLSNILVVNNISESRYVTFLGSYEYEPNKIAIDFIIDKILPICKLYQLRVIHCGGGKKPFTNSDSFISLGSIADLELYKLLSNSLCNLVPIKYGGGSKVKLLESILAGVPTLAYQESIKGLDFLLPGNPIISNNFFIHDFEKIIKNNFIFKEKAVELAREYRNIYEKYNTIDFK